MRPLNVRGVVIHQALLTLREQQAMVDDIRDVLRVAPLITPVTRWGKPMSVRMTSAGTYGWITDRRGYRYEPAHPNGSAWPAIPASVLDVWQKVSGSARTPDSCLINFYKGDARMGLHQDKDEADFGEPVVSISLGDDALFRIGNVEKGGSTESLWLASGDVAVMGGAARLVHHGVDRLRPGSSRLLRDGGRINLTLRVVT